MTLQVTAHSASLSESPRPERAVNWYAPTAGLWVATRGGDHAGRVERIDGVYHATNGRGRSLGWYPDLTAALIAVDGGEKEPFGQRPGVRAALWAVNGAAAAAATALAIALIR